MGDILVIKLSALGDFVQALGPFQAIRAHHRDDQITLLTTKAYGGLAEATGYFDRIWIDRKPKFWHFGKIKALAKQLNTNRWDFVYDLQTSDRSSSYYRLLQKPRPGWSGIAKGCSHPHANPKRDDMHTMDRQAEQLQMAGIRQVPFADLTFADKVDLGRFDLVKPYALLVPGGAPTRPKKRWPAGHYARLAQNLLARGIDVLAIGTSAEAEVLASLAKDAPGVRVLLDQTDFIDIIALGRRAVGALGNDTGPMHLIAASGCPSVVLFSGDSDPALCAPRGASVQVMAAPVLADLQPDPVTSAFLGLTGRA